MNLIYVLPVAAFLGLIAGIIIGKLAKEEFADNKKYLVIISRVILSVLIIYLASTSGNIIIFILGTVLGFFFRAAYLYFGLALASTLFAQPQSFAASALIFLYGMPYGTLVFRKLNIKILFFHLLVFLLPFILLIFMPNYSSVLASLSAGLLIGCLERKFD